MAVIHPQGPDVTQTATALLQAAQELDLPQTVVATTSSAEYGTGFVVPDEVARKFHKYMKSSVAPIRVDMDSDVANEPEPEPELDNPVPESTPEPEPEDKPSKSTPAKRGPRKAASKSEE